MVNGTDEKCRICDYPANGLHFGCFTCRACSEFFRRSVIDRKLYVCAQHKQCKMEKSMRYSCKYCRMKLCLDNGMRADFVQITRRRPRILKIVEIKQEKQEKTCLKGIFAGDYEKAMQTQILEMPPCPLKAIEKMSDGMGSYHWQQRSLYTLLYPDSDPDSYKMVLYDDYIRMARGCTSLVFQTLNDYFPVFAGLDVNLKESLMHTFGIHFAMLFQCHQTMLKYPDNNDRHFILHCGQLISCTTVSNFHQQNKDRMTATRHTAKIGDACGLLTDKMRSLKLRRVEMGALLGIKLWNELSFLSSSICPFADKERQHIYMDLYMDIENRYGSPKAGPRFGALLLLLNDLDVVTELMVQIFTMGRIFELFEQTIWDN